MTRLPSFAGRTPPLAYAHAAPALLISQHLVLLLTYRLAGWKLLIDADFLVLPLRGFALMTDLPAGAAAAAFAWSLLIAWGLALLSFRRARWSGGGYPLAALTIVPGVQVVAILLLALLPRFKTKAEAPQDSSPEIGMHVAHVIQGVLAGVAIIVLAVLVSAVTFGAYGWGLFVLTPLLVGMTTGYLANRRTVMSGRRTTLVVLAAAAFGTWHWSWSRSRARCASCWQPRSARRWRRSVARSGERSLGRAHPVGVR